MSEKALEARQLNLVTALLALIAFGGILVLGAIGVKKEGQRFQIARTQPLSDRQMLERRRARVAQAVIAASSAQAAP